MTEGTYYNSVRCMSFHRIIISENERETELRTDFKFRNRAQPEHHLEDSNLELLPIDMSQGFPTSDALHLFDLGIQKRFDCFVSFGISIHFH